MGFSFTLEDSSVGHGFARIFAEQMDRALSTLEDEDLSPGRRIHALRRRGKRLRGLFRLVRPGFRAYKSANAAIRDAARELSGSRDAAVLRETLVELCSWAGHPLPALDATPVDVAAERDALSRMRTSLERLRQQSAGWDTSPIDSDALAEGFAEGYRAGRRALKACRSEATDEHFHDWRKQVKYHGFHLLLLRRCLLGTASDVDRLEELAVLLGRHHDLAVLRLALESHPEGLAQGLDTGALRHQALLRQQRLADHAFRIGTPLFVRRPGDVRDGLLARWEAWQDNRERSAA